MQHNIQHEIIHEIEEDTPIAPDEAYVVIEETDLVNLIKNCRERNLQVGKDLGIISYNDTPLKEILLDGITTISADLSDYDCSPAIKWPPGTDRKSVV